MLEFRVLVPFDPGPLQNRAITHSPEEDLRRYLFQALRELRNVHHLHPQKWSVTGDSTIALVGERDSRTAGDALDQVVKDKMLFLEEYR